MAVAAEENKVAGGGYGGFIAEREKIWSSSVGFEGWGGFYHRRLHEIYRFIVEPGRRVLELGCSEGDLLAAVTPSYGLGLDLSRSMVEAARAKHPKLQFIESSVEKMEIDEKFDFIILSDLVNDLWDIQSTLERCRPLCHPHTRLVLNFYSRLWQPALTAVRKLKLARPVPVQNWVTVEDLSNFLYLAGYQVMRSWPEVLWPLPTPFVAGFFNRYLVKLWPFKIAGLTNLLVAKPWPKPTVQRDRVTVSVVVPARNEAGNVRNILEQIPELGGGTEIVFVEGWSKDDTYEVIEREMKQFPHRPQQLLRQEGEGKGDAVRLGFSKAKGEILMILDADLTVPPDDLHRFFEALVSGKGEFINDVRLVYPMQQQAMRFFNLVGNKFFSVAFSTILGQSIKDTLCGTKVLWKRDYERIAENRSYFGEFDPFGDFDLIFGAAKLNLKIVDVPVRYRERTYGTTNIQRWKHGWLLLKMVLFAARRIKFV